MRQVVRQLAERVDSQMDKAAKAAKGGKDDGRWAALLGIDLIEFPVELTVVRIDQ